MQCARRERGRRPFLSSAAARPGRSAHLLSHFSSNLLKIGWFCERNVVALGSFDVLRSLKPWCGLCLNLFHCSGKICWRCENDRLHRPPAASSYCPTGKTSLIFTLYVSCVYVDQCMDLIELLCYNISSWLFVGRCLWLRWSCDGRFLAERSRA